MSRKKDTNGDEICMLCGKWKEAESLVCRECFQRWYDPNAIEPTPIIKWVVAEAKICLVSIGKELQEAGESLSTFKQEIKKEAHEILRASLMGANVSSVDFSTMLEEKRNVLWAKKGGHKLFAHVKHTEHRAQNLPILIKELEAKIKKYEQEQGQKEEP